MPPPSTAAVGDLPIPSLVLDGDVTLRCDDIRLAAPNTVDVPALAVLGGTLCTDMLWLSNGMLVNAGGTLSVQGSVQELKRAVFRGGTTLLGAAEQKAEFILSGGTAHLADGLAEGSTVEGGAGVFSAQSFSGAAVNDYGAVPVGRRRMAPPIAAFMARAITRRTTVRIGRVRSPARCGMR